MAAFRPVGTRGMSEELLSQGDVELVSGLVQTNTTVGAATLTASQIIGGFIQRSGSVAGYTDTFDTSANIYNALVGNGAAPAIIPGLGLTLRVTNSVAFLETLTLGAGMVAGSGSVASIAASSWRDFLFTFLSVQPPVTLVGNNTNGSAVVTWSLQPGQSSVQEGVAPTSVNIMAGCSISGTGIPANATVLGVTAGVGGTLGVTMSANATSTNSNIAITFGPVIQVNSSGSGPL